jgi:DegV family protein with EDD domain
MSVAIVTDSTCDITQDLVNQYQIHVVPNLVIINGNGLEDGKGISRQEFYERLPSMKTPPTTATTSFGVYQQLYDQILNNGMEFIISLHPPSALSGIINAAATAAQTFGNRVHVLDSGQLSLGMGFQVLAAAEAAAQGASLDSILELIQDVRARVRLVAMLDTLEYIRRSGRVSWARARIGSLLQVKPFIEVKESRVLNLGETRTRRKGIERLFTLLKQLGPLDRLAILHTNAEADAMQILKDLDPDLPNRPLIVNVTTVIGTHVGPNGLGFTAVLR